MCEACGALWWDEADGREESWGDQFVEVIEELTDRARFTRGQRLRRAGAVSPLTVHGNIVTAEVRGSGRHYRVRIAPPRLSSEDIDLLATVFRDDASLLQRLTSGDHDASAMDELTDLADALDVELTPQQLTRLGLSCPCTDPGVCKHIVAAGMALYDLLEEQPTVWLELRGLQLDRLAAPPRPVLVQEPGEEPLSELVATYWTSPQDAPRAPTGLRPRPAPGEHDPDLLRAVLAPQFRGRGRRRATVEADVDAAAAAISAMYDALVDGGQPALATDA